MISKEEFVKAIEDIKWKHKFDGELKSFLKKNKVEGSLDIPDLSLTVIKLLHIEFGEADKDEWIEYFIFDLNFGETWKPGSIVENDKDISLSNARELYDYLISKL